MQKGDGMLGSADDEGDCGMRVRGCKLDYNNVLGVLCLGYF